MIRDTRGVSSPVGYTLTIVVALLLVTGLVTATSSMVKDQQSRTVRAQMGVVGHQVAGSLEAADRLANSTEGEPSVLKLDRTLPEELLGSGYTVDVQGGSETVVVKSRLADRPVVVSYHTARDVQPIAFKGSEFTVEYRPSSDDLVILHE